MKSKLLLLLAFLLGFTVAMIIKGHFLEPGAHECYDVSQPYYSAPTPPTVSI